MSTTLAGASDTPVVVKSEGTPAEAGRKGSSPVEIRIGLAHTARELSFESDESTDAVKKYVSDALASGTNHLSFTDAKGNSYIVPASAITFVEIGTDHSRRVGFVA